MTRIATASLVVLLLVGCSGAEHEDIKQWMNDQAKGMKGSVPPLPEIKPFPPVAYSGVTLVPPFANAKIITADGAADKAAPDRARPRQPLENFPLEDLRVTGVIIDGNTPYALVQPPAPNKPKHVKVGEYMGQNFGRITEISRDGVTVVETVKDANGAWTDREVSKRVPRDGRR